MRGKITRISLSDAPAPKGAYSMAVRAGDYIYVSGQGPVDHVTNEFSFGDVSHEARLTLSNIKRILEGCEASMQDVIKCSVFLADARDFAAMNEVYKTFWGIGEFPARTTVQVVLPEPQMKIEIDCVAYSPLS